MIPLFIYAALPVQPPRPHTPAAIETETTPELFFSGIPLPHSKNCVVLNTLPAVLPAFPAACVGIGHCAASPHTHNPPGGPARRGLHRTSKALCKNWRHSESFDTKKLASFTLVGKGDNKPHRKALFKLFDGVLFFLSIYLLEIRLVSIKYRGGAHIVSQEIKIFAMRFSTSVVRRVVGGISALSLEIRRSRGTFLLAQEVSDSSAELL